MDSFSFGFGSFARPAPLAATSDPAVAEVQRLLNILGYGPLVVDGILGPKTQSALHRFQGTVGLSASGQLDSLTVQKLQAVAASVMVDNPGVAPEGTGPNFVNTSLGPPQAPRPVPGIAPVQAPITPAAFDWKKTLLYTGSIVLVAGAAWLLFKELNGGGSRTKKRRSLAGVNDDSRTQCSRTPGERAFANAEAVEPPEED